MAKQRLPEGLLTLGAIRSCRPNGGLFRVSLPGNHFGVGKVGGDVKLRVGQVLGFVLREWDSEQGCYRVAVEVGKVNCGVSSSSGVGGGGGEEGRGRF